MHRRCPLLMKYCGSCKFRPATSRASGGQNCHLDSQRRIGSGTRPRHGRAGQDQELRILSQLFREAAAFNTMESVFTAHGRIAGDGAPDDFAGVRLEPNGENEARRYLEAEPGDVLNLDAKEIAAFGALKSASKDGSVPVQKVEALIREQLVARYQAYHTKGLVGITPYERKSGHHILANNELALATKQAKLVAKYLPSVYDAMINYPTVKTKDGEELEDQYYWLNIEHSGRPITCCLTASFFRIGEAYVVVDRHFYGSHEYNSLQQGMVALPTNDGILVTYLRRVSTDQVAGFGTG